jgi:hypothetical protein
VPLHPTGAVTDRACESRREGRGWWWVGRRGYEGGGWERRITLRYVHSSHTRTRVPPRPAHISRNPASLSASCSTVASLRLGGQPDAGRSDQVS